jgi:alpha-galactosidase
MGLLIAVVGLFLGGSAHGLVTKDGHTGRLPAMGWNSWNTYGCNINETVFLQVAELMNSLGLKELGYEYVNIDDCWSNKTDQRNIDTQEINPDLEKFPNGMQSMVEKVHSIGLKMGIYGDAGQLANPKSKEHMLTFGTGSQTCGGFAGSLGYEDIDAATFARWGIDCSFCLQVLSFSRCFDYASQI